MVHPKKITILASDGNRYSLMCKAKDELRKDSRLMDISRVRYIYYFSFFLVLIIFSLNLTCPNIFY